ncbi:HPF/RaiA family ribosome-associated protein [Aquabacterium sp. J223]|uniref:HPF/RaiA family ribosome-associated protein n=1 Tax=Aquabacterium sp. J223 TaxID=2898431 RepID=UPI0021AE0321|nr:HPF/RaiA family ribosome-associated protein [Aquabacterium sp. J223]UUX96922.1 HPF/RaiA family ribosome-associated protein [Aquabacterium sp. J223]
MQVQVHTDNHLDGRDELSSYVQSLLEDTLERHADQLTSVQAHLGDTNSGAKGGDNDMRCMFEARLAGHPPVAVTQLAPSLHQAINGAADKLTRALDTALGRQQEQQRRSHASAADAALIDPAELGLDPQAVARAAELTGAVLPTPPAGGASVKPGR